MPENVLDGARELLEETVSALNRASIGDFVVIGGWCPYLRNTSGVSHPGTLDVDLLFRDGWQQGQMRPAIQALKNAGFFLSAKHQFQLLLKKTIRGESLIYNVDLLHPNMVGTGSGLFVDHLDLDIPLDAEERRVKKVTSIVLPNSAVLFERSLFSEFTEGNARFNLIDFTGMFITKMDSCQRAKRERDAFDLYIGLKSNQIDFRAIAELMAANSRIEKSVCSLSDFLRDSGQVFDENVALFDRELIGSKISPAAELRVAMGSPSPRS